MSHILSCGALTEWVFGEKETGPSVFRNPDSRGSFQNLQSSGWKEPREVQTDSMPQNWLQDRFPDREGSHPPSVFGSGMGHLLVPTLIRVCVPLKAVL